MYPARLFKRTMGETPSHYAQKKAKENFAAALIQPPCIALQHGIIICIKLVSCMLYRQEGIL